MDKKQTLLPLAISFGEPAGIGSDLILSLYKKRKKYALPAFIVYGNLEFLKNRAKRLGLDIDFVDCKPQEANDNFASALPVFNIDGEIFDSPAQINTQSAPVVIKAIKEAVADVKAKKCRAIITAPIHKEALYSAGFKYPGHTEFLASLCAKNADAPTPIMMLAHEKYRAVPLTIHIALKDVPAQISFEKIIKTALIVEQDLKNKFNIKNPRIGIVGLNPHAGENGTIGVEEKTIIEPAISELQKRGINAIGPLVADTIFYPPHWEQYDCIIGMYHDQALIPIKTLAFDKGVNITLGLPIIRTSPDHGTAFDLAGSGKASINSMLAAILQADEMSKT